MRSIPERSVPEQAALIARGPIIPLSPQLVCPNVDAAGVVEGLTAWLEPVTGVLIGPKRGEPTLTFWLEHRPIVTWHHERRATVTVFAELCQTEVTAGKLATRLGLTVTWLEARVFQDSSTRTRVEFHCTDQLPIKQRDDYLFRLIQNAAKAWPESNAYRLVTSHTDQWLRQHVDLAESERRTSEDSADADHGAQDLIAVPPDMVRDSQELADLLHKLIGQQSTGAEPASSPEPEATTAAGDTQRPVTLELLAELLPSATGVQLKSYFLTYELWDVYRLGVSEMANGLAVKSATGKAESETVSITTAKRRLRRLSELGLLKRPYPSSKSAE